MMPRNRTISSFFSENSERQTLLLQGENDTVEAAEILRDEQTTDLMEPEPKTRPTQTGASKDSVKDDKICKCEKKTMRTFNLGFSLWLRRARVCEWGGGGR